jgi:hypothetical protein
VTFLASNALEGRLSLQQGSEVAIQWIASEPTTRAQINFDMIGSDEKDSAKTHGLIDIAPDTSNEVNIIGTKYSPDYRKEVEQANEFVGLRLNYKFDVDMVLNVLFRSDQYAFLLHDVPAITWSYWTPPGLSPGDRHGGQDQLREDGKNPKARLHQRVRLYGRSESTEVRNSGRGPINTPGSASTDNVKHLASQSTVTTRLYSPGFGVRRAAYLRVGRNTPK